MEGRGAGGAGRIGYMGSFMYIACLSPYLSLSLSPSLFASPPICSSPFQAVVLRAVDPCVLMADGFSAAQPREDLADEVRPEAVGVANNVVERGLDLLQEGRMAACPEALFPTQASGSWPLLRGSGRLHERLPQYHGHHGERWLRIAVRAVLREIGAGQHPRFYAARISPSTPCAQVESPRPSGVSTCTWGGGHPRAFVKVVSACGRVSNTRDVAREVGRTPIIAAAPDAGAGLVQEVPPETDFDVGFVLSMPPPASPVLPALPPVMIPVRTPAPPIAPAPPPGVIPPPPTLLPSSPPLPRTENLQVDEGSPDNELLQQGGKRLRTRAYQATPTARSADHALINQEIFSFGWRWRGR